MNLKHYNLKLTPISPIHIGTGQAYEPTNYIIDKDKVKDKEYNYLYAFDEFLFFRNLPDKAKADFANKLDAKADAKTILDIQRFIKSRAQIAKNIAYKKSIVSSEIAKDYNDKIGQFAQREQGVINQMVIEKTYTSPNLNKALIPGSSLKGAIATALREKSLSNLIIADSTIINSSTIIAEAINIKRRRDAPGGGLKTKMEAIATTSAFQTKLSLKFNENSNLDINKLITQCNKHYLPIFLSQFSYESDENTRAKLNSEFVKKYENFKPSPNQFLLRVGKHSGARAVTFDGQRQIWNQKTRENMEEETTTWIINKRPFGWLLCEVE